MLNVDPGLIYRMVLTLLTGFIWLVGCKLSNFSGFKFLMARELSTIALRVGLFFGLITVGDFWYYGFANISATLAFVGAFFVIHPWLKASGNTWRECISAIFN